MLVVDNSAPDGQHATTYFSTDADARTVENRQAGQTSNFDILGSKDWSKLGLHTLLSQPVPIFRGAITAGTPIDLEWFPFSEPLVKSPFHREKIRGYMGIRASLVIRVVVNADKYTQGRIALSYRPGSANMPNIIKDHRLITQLPHVELDLNTDTEVTLKIPHRGPYTHFDISNRLYNPGRFFVTELLAHRGNPYTYTVYSSFEDVDLIGPTGTTFNASYEGAMHDTEEKNVPLSQKVKELGSALMLAGSVPVLSSFIEPLGWATAVAGNVLSVFGFSKPLTTLTPHVYMQRSRPKYNQCDGTDPAETLAVTTAAQVRVTDQIGLTELDEMSFNYLLGLKSTMMRFSYGVSTPVGTKLGTYALCPHQIMASGPIGGTWVMHPISFLGNVFNHYRGSFSVTFEMSKTIFHTGRLMVVFEPVPTNRASNSTVQPQVATIEDAINCHKDVIDLRKGNAFTFDFPFTALVPYLPVEQAYGFVHLFVVNSLVRNDASVSDTVDVAVKFAGNDDFEFHGPCEPRFYPTFPDEGQGTFTPHSARTLNATYESGLEVGDTCITRKPIGSSLLPKPHIDLSQLCVGENIRSLKQVAMRSKLVYSGEQLINGMNYNPFVVDRLVADTLANPLYPLTCDFYSYVGSLFAYSRGGVIYTLENMRGAAKKWFCMTYDAVSRPPRDGFAEFHLVHEVLAEQSDRIYIPPCDTSFVRTTYPTNSLGFFNRDNTGIPSIEHSHDSSKAKFFVLDADFPEDVSTNLFKLHRAAAEDTQFGGFASVPLMSLREPFKLSSTPEGVPTEYRLRVGILPNS